MKSALNSFNASVRNLGIPVLFLIVAISCTKSSDNPKGPTQIKYCGQMDFTDTFGDAGTFNGAYVDAVYNLVYFQYKAAGQPSGGFPLHYDANNHLISDQPGVTYTYNADTLTKISITNGIAGNGSYSFDGKGRLIGGTITLNDQNGSSTVTGTYTYDDNDDPVKFTASGTLSSSQGSSPVNMVFTGSFLLNETSLLPFQPEFAPFSTFFSLIPFTSKHLLDKWDISIVATGINLNATDQYSYTYDSNGNVATMVRTGNTHNTYTFTYSACN